MSRLVRQIHRWTSILFTLIVAALFAASAMGPVTQWVYLTPLAPLAVMAVTGLWMFVQPYLRAARG
jgi:hypothetical protein